MKRATLDDDVQGNIEEIRIHSVAMGIARDTEMLDDLGQQIFGTTEMTETTVNQSKELQSHHDNGHAPKDKHGEACHLASGPRKVHLSQVSREGGRATLILRVDLSGPHGPAWPCGSVYPFVGVARPQAAGGASLPLLLCSVA